MSISQIPIEPECDPITRWQFIREVLTFQLKLFLDAIRDFGLVPISLIAGFIDLLVGGKHPGWLFYRVFNYGKRLDDWVNLFETSQRPKAAVGAKAENVDAFVDKLERLVVDQYEQGGITASAKNTIDRALDAISSNTARLKPNRSKLGKEDPQE